MKQSKKIAKKTWRVFSEYIKLRNADKNGYVRCITCGKMHYYKGRKINAGHYYHRGRGSYTDLDFDEDNVNPQCVYCNKYRNGAIAEYTEFLSKKGVLEKLKCKKKFKTILSDFELGLIYKIYSEKLEVEEVKRGF